MKANLDLHNFRQNSMFALMEVLEAVYFYFPVLPLDPGNIPHTSLCEGTCDILSASQNAS